MNDKLFIYVLNDPSEVSQTIYVGFTNNPKNRLARHLQPGELAQNRHKDCWIKSLLNRDVIPEMIILEETNKDNWQEAEQFYISYFRSLGMKLCNSTDGGDGTLGHKHTDETKQLMREKKLGTTQTDETKDKNSHQGIKDNLDEIIELYKAGYSLRDIAINFDANHQAVAYRLEKAGIELREEKFTDRAIDKLRDANIGKTQTAETKQKRSNSLKGRTRPPEVCAKISAAHKGKRLTEEHKAKLSIARQGMQSPTYKAHIDDAALIKMYEAGLSFRAIGREVGLEHHAVKARLKKNGVLH